MIKRTRPWMLWLFCATACSSDASNGGMEPPPNGGTVASVQVAPATAALTPTTTRQFTATARDAAGNAVNGTLTWTSSIEYVASVNTNGLASGLSAGTTEIRATAANGVYGSAQVSVTAPPAPQLQTALFQNTSAVSSQPNVTVQVPAGHKVLSCGGRSIDASGDGILLTAVYPSDARACTAAGKEHITPGQGAVQVWAIALVDPNDEWDVRINSMALPGVASGVSLPAPYALTGGGAKIEFQGVGALLTSSRPNGNTWLASGKEHIQADATAITTSYVIGIRPRNGAAAPVSIVTTEQSTVDVAQVPVLAGATFVGGGGTVTWAGQGRLLVGSYPDQSSWVALGREHTVTDRGTVTVYAIGLR